MVLHVNGIHAVNVMFCQCDELHHAGDRVQQLMRFELYPATMTDPSTCATFRAMEQFHRLTLQSKIPAYDYYMTLNHTTDNTEVQVTWVRRQ